MRLVLPLVAAVGVIAGGGAGGGGGGGKEDGGRRVRLTVDNCESAAVHDLTVAEMPVMDVLSSGAAGGMGHAGMDVGAEYDLHIALDGGGVGALEFTPTQSGEFVFICTVPGHEQAGMTGKLIVIL